jgi:hypothetical protein
MLISEIAHICAGFSENLFRAHFAYAGNRITEINFII